MEYEEVKAATTCVACGHKLPKAAVLGIGRRCAKRTVTAITTSFAGELQIDAHTLDVTIPAAHSDVWKIYAHALVYHFTGKSYMAYLFSGDCYDHFFAPAQSTTGTLTIGGHILVAWLADRPTVLEKDKQNATHGNRFLLQSRIEVSDGGRAPKGAPYIPRKRTKAADPDTTQGSLF